MSEEWHLDKRVPISLIFAILLQTIMFVWLLSSMNSKIDNTIQRTSVLEAIVAQRNTEVARNTTGIAVANESLKAVQASLIRIEKKLDSE